MSLRISSAHRQFLLNHAAAAGTVEVCGLLLGSAGRIEQLVPARNVAANPARSFEIDPATLLATHRNARSVGLSVIGHWHSHPNGRAEPSSRDAARAVDGGQIRGQIWLIIAAGSITAWRAETAAAGPARFAAVALETG